MRHDAAHAALGKAMVASALLAAAKFGLGLATGSLVVIASAAESFADAAMSGLNRWARGRALEPADAGHPYGHGKLEGTVALGQATLLAGLSVSLAASAVVALYAGSVHPLVLPAIATLVGSGAVAAMIGWLLGRAGREARSVVLNADAAHYRVDLYGAGGAVLGLALAGLTGRDWLDPASSLVIAALMAREAWAVGRGSFSELLDESLPAEEIAAIEAVFRGQGDIPVRFHGLRTRRSGPLRFVEVHAELPPDTAFGDVHLLVQDLAAGIERALPGTRVLVHPDAQGLHDSADQVLEG